MVDAEETTLWAQRAEGLESASRLKLFARYLPFARMIAVRLRKERPGADLDLGDMRQNAALGLMQAIDRFDPDRGVSFKTYAARRIAGAVIDGIAESNELRRQVFLQQRQRAERVRSALARQSVAIASPEAALDALSELVTDLALGLIADSIPMSDAVRTDTPVADAYESLAWRQIVSSVAKAIAALPERDRNVIELHYKAGLEFTRIAEILGLSKGRVSQIHAVALKRLRDGLPSRDHVHFQG